MNTYQIEQFADELSRLVENRRHASHKLANLHDWLMEHCDNRKEVTRRIGAILELLKC